MHTWPPPYKVRISTKAKHPQLKITASAGLEVIMPSFNPGYDILALLATKKTWLQKHLAKLQHNKPSNATWQQLPNILPLNAIQEIWQITYVQTSSTKVTVLTKPNYQLVCYGPLNANSIQAALLKWLKAYAKQTFAKKLLNFSKKINIPYQSLSVRGQKTRWGSCNTKGNISLNFKLLFLPAALLHYVMLHELCHIKQLNHSSKFWQLLAKYDANFINNRQALKTGDQYVPLWICSQ